MNEQLSKEYVIKTYEQLSKEFQTVAPYAKRAHELIPAMYNRLTLIDKLSDKEAKAKMAEDHKHLHGFTDRNIRRYLPVDNPIVPRRPRTPRPKPTPGLKEESNDIDTYGIVHDQNNGEVKDPGKVAVPKDKESEAEPAQLKNSCSELEGALKQQLIERPESALEGEIVLVVGHLAGIFAEQHNGTKEFYLKHDGKRVTGVQSDRERRKMVPGQ